ncbi:MAG: NifB/NifX family molybdenum-iron cluster-binding protein [Acholeplasmataceae bacterium]|nr:NifB/NifX family molybdenum-iron cluster-binding protein [Acholeplasmataceae bacterium]
MKIAIACTTGLVSDHFGHSDSFEIYSVNSQERVFIESLQSPEHQHGSYPAFLKMNGVETLICGTIGRGAIQHMNAHKIEVISGVSGKISEILDLFTQKKLASSDAICSGHDHDHDHNHECHHDKK